MSPGERLRVLATDPKARGDFELFCVEAGHQLLESAVEGEVYRFVIERG
jgi:tRNA 2-thiouridine synthesizing protein A